MDFVTGFPGFLGSDLVRRLVQRPGEPVVCLVQPAYAARARAVAGALAPHAQRPVRLVEGDLTAPDLGLGGASWRTNVRRVFHLAAAYDLGVDERLALRVNVDGTRHVLRFCAAAPVLERLHYVSTCYVCGTHAGTFREEDLDVGQGFYNAYERTKYLAEADVRAAMHGGLAATVYRPSIVVGDADTGATQKYDGPYSIIRWMLRWARTAPLPLPGGAARSLVNLVPRSFVGAALDALAHDARSAGTTVALADPAPLTVDALLRVLEAATGRRAQRLPVPLALGAAALRFVPGLEAWSGLRAASLPYFAHRARFSTETATRLLAPHGLTCPPFEEYAAALVAFVQAHPDVATGAMV